MAFSFGFGGDDIDGSNDTETQPSISTTSQAPTASAFPVAGKPQLPPTLHDLHSLLARLPSKIAYDTLEVTLDDGTVMSLPRRELWDVRVQLMAEDDSEDGTDVDGSGLGNHDVKTGVYEGGFKSWESSVDLVKVLAAQGKQSVTEETTTRVVEV
jgi:protein-histidine N-methyltransferase